MRSYRVHACTPQANGKIPYIVLSLCGAQRVSLDMGGMTDRVSLKGVDGPQTSSVALTMEALYELLQGNPIRIERNDGAIKLCPDGPQLVIQKEGTLSTTRVWMAELALAWNMLSGFGTRQNPVGWNLQ